MTKTLKLFSSTTKRLLLAIVATVTLAMILRYGLGPQPILQIAAAAIAAGLVLWAIVPAWRSLDEAAREAHTSAFFWGGTFGFLVFLFLGMIEMVSVPYERPHLPEWLAGVIVTFGVQLVGYLIFHVVWWLRRGGLGRGE